MSVQICAMCTSGAVMVTPSFKFFHDPPVALATSVIKWRSHKVWCPLPTLSNFRWPRIFLNQ